MQKLNVELMIEIPAAYVLISKVELQQLKQNELYGVYWNMKDLESRTGRKQLWLKENMLYRERFSELLDVENGTLFTTRNQSGSHGRSRR